MSPLHNFSPKALRQYIRTQKERNAAQGTPSTSTDIESPIPSNEKSSPFTALSDVKETQVRWLWPRMIPLGQITLLDGDPGVGKSTVMTDLAARVSVGESMPDGTPGDLERAVGVLLITTEDPAGSTIRSRATSAGAEISNLHVLSDLEQLSNPHFAEGRFTLPKDANVLSEYIGEHQIKLCVLDPVLEFLSTGYDFRTASDVRNALIPLQVIAAKHDCAVVLLRHLNKSIGQSAIQRGQGSMAFLAVARSSLIVAHNPDFDDDSHFVLANPKSSNSTKSASISYELISDDVLKCGRVAWGGIVRFTANELTAHTNDIVENSSRREIVDLLLENTAQKPIAIREAQELVRNCLGPFSPKTIKRAAIAAELVTLNSRNVPPLRYWARKGQTLSSLDMDSVENSPVHTESAENKAPTVDFSPSVDNAMDESALDWSEPTPTNESAEAAE